MLIVFPQDVRRRGLLNNAAENTIHVNHRRCGLGLGVSTLRSYDVGGLNTNDKFTKYPGVCDEQDLHVRHRRSGFSGRACPIATYVLFAKQGAWA
ncbi:MULTISPECIES: hypothetical protein [unclassified Pseudomonas]|uniref:hypothetical protein n=1 Tax=unclassified Pseudomonas TaxID=196821 RepID=UPI001430F432|nr:MULTISPECIES: hypothetical protein [unclassified Pseudomonas]